MKGKVRVVIVFLLLVVGVNERNTVAVNPICYVGDCDGGCQYCPEAHSCVNVPCVCTHYIPVYLGGYCPTIVTNPEGSLKAQVNFTCSEMWTGGCQSPCYSCLNETDAGPWTRTMCVNC